MRTTSGGFEREMCVLSLAGVSDSEEEDGEGKGGVAEEQTYLQEQETLKASFKAAAENASDQDILIPRHKTDEDKVGVAMEVRYDDIATTSSGQGGAGVCGVAEGRWSQAGRECRARSCSFEGILDRPHPQPRRAIPSRLHPQ